MQPTAPTARPSPVLWLGVVTLYLAAQAAALFWVAFAHYLLSYDGLASYSVGMAFCLGAITAVPLSIPITAALVLRSDRRP